MTISLTLFIATEEAHAKGNAPGGGGGGGGGSGGGKESSGGGGGDLPGAGGLLNDGGGAGGGGDKKQKEGPVVSGSPGGATNDPKPALANSEPVREKASGGDLRDDGASGQTSEPILSSSDSPVKTTSSPTSDPAAPALAPALAPAIDGTKDTLEGITQPVSTNEPLSSTSETISETIQPLVAGVEEAPQVIGSALEEATKSTVDPLLDSGDGTLDPVLGNTAEPLLKTAEPLLGDDPLATLTPLGQQAPEGLSSAPISSGSLPTPFSPTTAPELLGAATPTPTPTFFEPFAQGEGAPLPSSVLGAAESPALAPPLPAPNNSAAAGAAPAGATREATAPSLGLATDANKEVSTTPVVLNTHHRAAALGTTTILGAALTSWAKDILADAPSPFSPAAPPVAGSAFGGFAGSGLGLSLLAALALLLGLARVNTLLRSSREPFSASSYLQLAIERPG